MVTFSLLFLKLYLLVMNASIATRPIKSGVTEFNQRTRTTFVAIFLSRRFCYVACTTGVN